MSRTLDQARVNRENLLLTIQRVSEGLATTRSNLEVAKLIVHEGLIALGSNQGALHMMNATGDALEAIYHVGYPVSHLPLSQASPLTEAVRTGQPKFLVSEDLYHYPQWSNFQVAAIAIIPLELNDRVMGSLSFNFPQQPEFEERERAFLLALAAQGALALERIRLKKLEEKLRLDNEIGIAHLQTLLSSHPLGMALLDTELRYQQINEPLARLNGATIAEHLGRTPAEVLKEGAKSIEPHLREVLASGKPIRNLEVSLTNRNGERQYFLVNVYPVRKSGGAMLGVGCTVNDITANKVSQERLKESEAYFRALAETLPGFVWMDGNGGINEYMNQRWTEFTGQSVDEARNDGWKAVTHPDDIGRIEALWQHCRKTGQPYETELRHRHKLGHYAWFLSKGLPLRNDKGEIIRWVGASIDITARKQAEASLQVSEARFRELTNVVPEIILRCDPHGYLEFINQRWTDYTGMSQAETFDKGVWPAIHPDDVEADRTNFERCIASGDLYHGEYRLRRHDGVYRWHLERGVPMRDAQGHIVHWFHAITDIHDQKQTETALRESRERYQTLVKASSQIVWTADAQGLQIIPQQGWVEFTGQAATATAGAGWLEFIHPEDRERILKAWRKAVRQKSFFFEEQRLRFHDSSYRHMEVRAAPVLNQDGSVREWIGTHTDVTDRVMSEAKLEKQTRILHDQAELLSLANEAIIISTPGGNIVSWNQAATDLYGYTEKDAIGQNRHELFQINDTALQKDMEESLKEAGFWEGEVIHKRKDGENIVLLSRLAQRRDAQGQPHEIVEVNWDITARKQVEIEREKLLELTRRSEKEALALAEIASSFSLSKPLETNLSSVAERVVITTGAAACGIEIFDADSTTLHQSGSYGYPPDLASALMQLHHQRVKTLSQEAIKERSVVIRPDYLNWALNDPARAPIHDFIKDLNWGTAVAMPVMSGKRPGAVVVYYPKEADPDLTDLLQLSTIISQIALLVENIRLFEEAQGKAALEERQRLARDLHDSVSQSLYGISLGANSVKQALKLDMNQEKLNRLEQTLDYLIHMSETAMAEMKSLIFELRPDSLEREGLVAALRKQVRALELRYRFKLELDLSDEPEIPIRIKEMLYRVAQEAMNNIVKHARASKISLRLLVGNGVELEVRDNGIGFDPKKDYPGHLGLRSMSERTEALGATFKIQSDSQGTRVYVRVEPGDTKEEPALN